MSETKQKFFYGWVITALGFGINATFGAGLYYGFGVFFPVMMADLGISRGVGSTAFSIMLFVQAFGSPVIGSVISRWGTRKVMISGSVLMVASMALMSAVDAAWQIYVVFGIFASLAILSSGYLSVVTLVNNWFKRRRSLATGICVSGVGIGTVILAPTFGYLIETAGWRNTWLVLAGIATMLSLIPTIFLAKPNPESVGQRLDGDSPSDATARDAGAIEISLPSADWDTKAVLKSPVFWLILACGTANLFTLNMLSNHQVAHLRDMGIPPVAAASAIGFLVGTSTIGRLGGGFVGDRFPLRYVAACACAVEVIALIILLNARAMPLIYLYVVIFGTACGTILVLFPSIIGAYFGRKNYAAIYGIAFGVVNFLAALSPAFAGFVFDATGSYLIPLTVATVLVACAGVCVLLARPPKIPQA